ncbi:MAG: hypothetical protein WAN43_19435 [Rhodomicrobium sp.]|jgi:hypothetical protein
MAFCDNVFCSNHVRESESVPLAGRKFCCEACAEDWYRQNEALAEPAPHAAQTAAGPSLPPREDLSTSAGATLQARRSAA